MTLSHFPDTILIDKLKDGVSEVDSVTRSNERRKLMLELLERKVRLRARQLYEERGQAEGQALEDWVKAESEVMKSSILAPLWNAREHGGLGQQSNKESAEA
jgi:Protein of unknown function (DUF2934)